MSFNKIAIIGVGLIGSSIAQAVRKNKASSTVIGYDLNQEHCDILKSEKITDSVTDSLQEAVEEADCVFLCVPPSKIVSVAKETLSFMKKGAVLTDVGSIKLEILEKLEKDIPQGIHLIPGHPVAGTEHSGPLAGFAELFVDRWCILTPSQNCDPQALQQLSDFWKKLGSQIKIMDAHEHDLVLAITSHLPHLIAYTIVGTAVDLEEDIKGDVIKFSAGGFRDFTRIAASDPSMWRDILSLNKKAVLEVLGRFSEDLSSLQRAIRRGQTEVLYDYFDRARTIRREVIKEHQDIPPIGPDLDHESS